MLVRALVLIYCVAVCSAQASEGEFHLDQIAADFPSQGLEDKVHFWTQLFTKYGETDILFHDREDVRLVYEALDVKRGIERDPKEAKLQRKLLRKKRSELSQLFEDLQAGRKPGPEHQKIIGLLTQHGYEPTPSLYERLSEDIRYQRGVKEKFEAGVVRSARYLKAIEQAFSDQGLPVELSLLPHVESSFQYAARSSAGAAGIWQIVRGTGRAHLKITRYIDERLDPVKASKAAAEILKKNYESLGNWPLALTAYNYGLNGMLRAKKAYGPDLLEIMGKYETRSFGFSSKNFYAEFLAAVNVHMNRESYFGPLDLLAPIQYETLKTTQTYRIKDLLQAGALTEDQFRTYNPALTRHTWGSGLVPSGFVLRLPIGTSKHFAAKLAKTKPVSSPSNAAADGSFRYRIRRGDTLSSISEAFGSTVKSIQAANGIINRNQIRIGQQIIIPVSSERPLSYEVRKGDTLTAIAQKFGTSTTSIRRANSLADANRIAFGQILLIP